MGRRRERKPHHKKSLQDQIEDPQSNGVRTHPRADKKRSRGEEDEEKELLDARISGRILKAAREQQEELEAEELEDDRDEEGALNPQAKLREAVQQFAAAGCDDSDNDAGGDSDDEDVGAAGLRGLLYGGKGALAGDDDDAAEEEEEVDPEDARALAAFAGGSGAVSGPEAGPSSLGDLILSRIRAQQAQAGLERLPGQGEEGEEAGPSPGGGPLPDGSLEPKVVEVYRGVGRLLSRYTSGKVPKAFKIIPNLRNWEEVLYLTDPEGWSPHAVYQATRLFVSNLNSRLAQRFMALVLLPRMRQEMREKKKLHLALFMALKKATYKPGAFYKGIVLPLASARDVTLREAFVIAAVLKRVSLPVLHSAAALLRLSGLSYQPMHSYLMQQVLLKKYALPYRVIDAMVDHFVRMSDDERPLPSIWFLCMLTFVQLYRDQVRPQDLEALRRVCGVRQHPKLTPEIQRELDHSKARGQAAAAAGGGAAPMEEVRLTGAAAAAQQSRMGANVTESTRDMPPVLMMDE